MTVANANYHTMHIMMTAGELFQEYDYVTQNSRLNWQTKRLDSRDP